MQIPRSKCRASGFVQSRIWLRATRFSLLAGIALAPVATLAGQAPGAASDPDIPVSHKDRVYAAERFFNTVSVTDPESNKLLGVIRPGDPQPGNLSPLSRARCSSTAWASLPITRRSRLCRSAPTR